MVVGKTAKREMRVWEEQAAKAAELKERAAGLLRQVETIELQQKRRFESVVLEAVYAAGLQQLPLSKVVAGLHALRDMLDSAEMHGVNTDRGAQPIKANVDGSGSPASEATIGLVVKIGRNTAPGRFAVLNEYLTWNGKDGHWSGKVSSAALAVFEATFERGRLVVSKEEREQAGTQVMNTAGELSDDGPDAPGEATQTTSELVAEIGTGQPAGVKHEEDEPPAARGNAAGSAWSGADAATSDGEVVDVPPTPISPSGNHQAADLAKTISAGEVDPGSMAAPGTPPELLGPMPTSRLPRPFAGLPRRTSS
jgi:hypothetical protein